LLYKGFTGCEAQKNGHFRAKSGTICGTKNPQKPLTATPVEKKPSSTPRMAVSRAGKKIVLKERILGTLSGINP